MVGRLTAAAALVAAGFFTVSGSAFAGSVGICSCCEGEQTATCKPVCEAAQSDIGFCRPAVVVDGDTGTPKGANPLASPSLKYLSLSGESRMELEATRRFFERWRRIAEARFGKAQAEYLAGKSTKAAYEEALAERNAVLVNYQHGIRAYRAAREKQATASN